MKKKSSSNTLLIGFLIVLAFFTGYLFFKVQFLEKNSTVSVGTQAGDQPQAQQPQTGGKPVNIKNVKLKGQPYIGDKNAPVTLAYWFDFQCPFCKSFETNTMSTLINQYVKAGKLRIVFKNYQFLGEDSQTAGLAEKAVWELYPDQYFAWHEAIYKAQDDENAGFGNKESIIQLTRTISGINADKVLQLMDQKKGQYQKEIDSDKAEGTAFGINGTPGFVIDTQLISGAQPAKVFTQVIDALLKK